ncbi:NADH dehydrogenase [ubiquinone] flavoprotein 3, mitochondrial [Dipodomys spectabilis]|uniref:NADH dehydrogenase [ubiquinone] flavoprotein 3, mitochondrial n=1 Tax=Dipodomys spectabilis TaxID=105255 RepID=UPI001C546E24|nr:NADH dehydrogenase [ubiquinone] flavoprotein 3, mitochondrial [Dipodomys spectabilis]
MAAWVLLRRRPPGVLKTMLLETQMFRGLTSTASLCELVKNNTGLPSGSKKPSPSKNVVQAKERGQPLTSQPAAGLAAPLSPPGSPPTGGNKGQVAPGSCLGGSMRLTDEGLPRPLSRKTLVEFPQKVPSPPREQGSDSDSSSSSSSSSDSESDEEELSSEAAPQVVSKGKKGFPKPEASGSSKNRAPEISGSAKEETEAQRPQSDVTYPEQPPQPRKKGARPTPVMPRPQAEKDVLKQNLKEEQLQKRFRLNETEKASQKPREVKEISADHTQGRLSAGLSPEPTSQIEEAGPRGQLPTTVSGAQRRQLEPKETEPGREAAPLLAREENAGKLETGLLVAKDKTGDAQVPAGSWNAVPVQKAVFNEKTVAPKLKGVLRRWSAQLLPRKTRHRVLFAIPWEPVQAKPTQAEPKQAKPVQAPVPSRPFDNAIYRNLQHHNYNAYTFLDVNLDLSKFRLPQPSSGRESPRH